MTRSAPENHLEVPAQADGQWLRDLRPRQDGLPPHKPASHPPLIAEVTYELGEGPVAWAIDLGHQMATRIIAEIPALGGSEELVLDAANGHRVCDPTLDAAPGFRRPVPASG